MPIAQYIRRRNVLDSLGNPIKDLSLEEAIDKAGLNYQVGIMETRVRLPKPDTEDEYLLYKVPGNFATYRTDNNHVFGSVGAKYEIVQNSVALDFIEQVCDYDKNIRIETAGMYNDGASMLVTAKFTDSMSVTSKDDIDRYLLFTNSHDGSGSICCAVTNLRVICNNMLNAALKGAEQMFRFMHTKNVMTSLQQAINSIKQSYLYSEVMKEQFEALRAIPVADKNIKGYVYKLLLKSEQIEYLKTSPNIMTADTDIISTKLKNKVTSVIDTIESGVGQELHRGTLLWLYNGFNCYINNVANYKNDEDRFISLTKSTGYKLNQKAYDLALSAIAA